MNSFWQNLTWFGDSGFLLPAAIWVAAWLAFDRTTRTAAIWWVLLFGSCGFIVMVSKLAFMGWGIGNATYNFTGFSGHTALSTSVWPVVCWLVAPRTAPRMRLAAAGLGWLWGVAIGISRLALQAHSNSEVIAGLLLGTMASAGFLWLQHGRPVPRWGRRWLLIGLLVPTAFLPVGKPAPTQDALEAIAIWMANIERPFTRSDLLQRRISVRLPA